jgi:hypothetical protein
MGRAAQVAKLLECLSLLPRRLLLETPGVQATVPMLRGVWGAALHDLDGEVYRTVFAPQAEGGEEAASLYVLRPAPPDPDFAPAIEWLSLGTAIASDGILRRAWDIASGMGLGPQRQRFHIRRVVRLNPDGTPGRDETWGTEAEGPARGWPLSDAARPLPDPASAPCRLVFPVPLRLRRHGRLIEAPTLPDLIVAATRRIAAYLPAECRAAWKERSREALQLARATPAGAWRGERLDLQRYSARQDAELDLHGVAGSLDLPRGPGELWPLLAAAQWLHLGKGTVMGLGQLRVEG